MENRRKYQRLAEKIKVHYQIIYSTGFGSEFKNGEGSAHSINLSEGGLLFISNNFFPENTFLEVELRFPNEGMPIYLKGQVLHSIKEDNENGYEIRMMFEYSSDKDRKMLQEHVGKNLELSE